MIRERSIWYGALSGTCLAAASLCAFLGHDHWWFPAAVAAAFGTRIG